MRIHFTAAAIAEVSLQETGTPVTLKPDGTRLITVPEEHYVEMTITFPIDQGSVCFGGVYFEDSRWIKQSANLLGVFCGFHEDKEYVFGQVDVICVAPVLIQVKTTQFVLYNHPHSVVSAGGAPAPVIFWRKDGIVVQTLLRCPGPCQCTHYKGTHSLLSVICVGKQLKSIPWTLPMSTAV
ncbi:hypothetical protein OS493_032531, partial [Desmophyllum pertusum]